MNLTSNQDRENNTRRMVPLRYVLIPITIILVAVTLLILATILAPKPIKKPQVFKAPLVKVSPLLYRDITFSIDSQGSVVPRTETRLISEVSGMVTQVSDKFQVGGFFQKGDVLLSIDDISYKVALLQAQSGVD